MPRRVSDVIDRAVSVAPEDLQSTVIIRGRPPVEVHKFIMESLLSMPPHILEKIKRFIPSLELFRIRNLSEEVKGEVSRRPIHTYHPLNVLASETGLEVFVDIYEIAGVPVYVVTEPPVDTTTKKFYLFLKERFGEYGVRKPQEALSVVKEVVDDFGLNYRMALRTDIVRSALYYAWRDTVGYGPLDAGMIDPEVEEISWFAYDGPAEVVDRAVTNYYPNVEFTPTNIFLDPSLPREERQVIMTRFVRYVTGKAGLGLTIAKPVAEGRVPDPSGRGFHRLAAHLGIMSRSPAVTIRKFPLKQFSIVELISLGTLSPLEAAYLVWQLIRRGFILIVGGMASGKTSTLQALISAVPAGYKVITIEDTPELSTPAWNWHPLYVRRAPSGSEVEDITFSKNVKHSLRHRGTIVTLGEVRGEEMADLIQAAASGHGAICLPGDTPIVARRRGGTPNVVPIKAVVEGVLKGEEWEAYSYSAERGVFEWRRVTNAVKVPTDRWVVIQTGSGRTLRMTPDHRVLVYDPETGKFKVMEAKDLAIGDMIPVAGLVEYAGVPELKEVLCCGVLVPLNVYAGRVVGFMLRSGYRRTRIKPTEKVREAMARLPLPFKGEVWKREEHYPSVLRKFLFAVLEALRRNPLGAPKNFLKGIAEELGGDWVLLPSREDAVALHYALHRVGVDSITAGRLLKVVGGKEEPLALEQVVSVSEERVEGEMSYDIEVEGNHNFLTGDSILTSNCTFHARDPFSVLARITSPPINAAPEHLKLITSIVHIARTKEYSRGVPRSARRVLKVYEVVDVKGRNPETSVVFSWNPMTDEHHPPFTVRGLIELWRRSVTVRTMGYEVYVDEAPKALAEIAVLADFFLKLSKARVTDIRTVSGLVTVLYNTRFDERVERMWNKLKSRLQPLMGEGLPIRPRRRGVSAEAR